MMPAKVSRKFDEGDIFFPHRVQNADGNIRLAGQPDDAASRTTKLAVQRLDLHDGRMEVLLKQRFENVHEFSLSRSRSASSITRTSEWLLLLWAASSAESRHSRARLAPDFYRPRH